MDYQTFEHATGGRPSGRPGSGPPWPGCRPSRPTACICCIPPSTPPPPERSTPGSGNRSPGARSGPPDGAPTASPSTSGSPGFWHEQPFCAANWCVTHLGVTFGRPCPARRARRPSGASDALRADAMRAGGPGPTGNPSPRFRQPPAGRGCGGSRGCGECRGCPRGTRTRTAGRPTRPAESPRSTRSSTSSDR